MANTLGKNGLNISASKLCHLGVVCTLGKIGLVELPGCGLCVCVYTHTHTYSQLFFLGCIY